MYTRGDTIQLEVTIDDDITNWKIRAEIYDDENESIQIASAEAGGSTSQITKTLMTATKSTFLLNFASGDTDNIADKAYLVIQVDTGATINGQPELLTIFKTELIFTDRQITWSTPA